MHDTGRLLFAVALLFLFNSCDLENSQRDVSTELPCEVPAQRVDLGSPVRDQEPAEFTLKDGRVWATFQRGAPERGFVPAVKHGILSIGSQSEPPFYDPESGRIENQTATYQLEVGEYTELRVGAGRYWALHTVGVSDLQLLACQGGVISD